MTQYLSQESLALLLFRAFLLGMMIGAVYSLFSIRRAAFLKLHIPRAASAILLHLEDFLVCVAAGAMLSILYFATTSGVLRLMAIPALGVGILLWRLTAGRLITVCTDRILHLLAVLCRWILRRILSPIGRAVQSTVRRLRRHFAAGWERRFYRRLARQAKQITLRYGAALTASAGRGTLPTPTLCHTAHTKNRKKQSKPKKQKE
ncbi:MAG: spore cortex biosynthesis protein YabQ [Clostridia bacterium]|nr:spore cortex biosynthesis protein YabQ [Clostridia bacterium]